jgi:hypothetical protein
MARYVVKVLASTDTLKKLERAIQQLEEIDFTAVSVSSGTVGGKKGKLLTLLRGAPDGRVTCTRSTAGTTTRAKRTR